MKRKFKKFSSIIMIVMVIAMCFVETTFAISDTSAIRTLTESDGLQLEESSGATVYWVPNGEVYHLNKNCSSLNRSKTIKEGTIKESGKSRLCKICGKGASVVGSTESVTKTPEINAPEASEPEVQPAPRMPEPEYVDGWQRDENGNIYYYEDGKPKTGWIREDRERRYGDTEQTYTETTWYYADADGSIAKGWRQIGGEWYYFYEGDGSMFCDATFTIDNKQYNFNENGQLRGYGGGWLKRDTDWGTLWYYTEKGGDLAIGWKKVGGAWYYFEQYSGCMTTGWVSDGGAWYYMNSSGAMQTGWIQSGGAWYYLKSSGAMAANEYIGGYWLNGNGSWTYPHKATWRKSGNRWWYGDTSGWYAKNGTYKIDGTVYTFDAVGWMK